MLTVEATRLLDVGPTNPARLDPQQPVIRADRRPGEFLNLQAPVVDQDRGADHLGHEAPSLLAPAKFVRMV